MKINKEINQQKFKNEYQKALINILFTSGWLSERLKTIFDRDNLTMQQFNILRILRGSQAPLSTLQIRERMLDKMSDTSRIVDRLILKGLAKKKVNRTDKRLVDVTITDQGLALLEKMDTYEDEMKKILENLDATEAKTLNTLLDKIRN